jgi:hypothetical protein
MVPCPPALPAFKVQGTHLGRLLARVIAASRISDGERFEAPKFDEARPARKHHSSLAGSLPYDSQGGLARIAGR